MTRRSLVSIPVSPPEPPGLVPYLTLAEEARLAAACCGRNRARNKLLILTLFQSGLRISEALSLMTRHLGSHPGWRRPQGPGQGWQSPPSGTSGELGPPTQEPRLRSETES